MISSKTKRLARLFGPDGRALIVAMDHVGFVDVPLPALGQPEMLIADLARAGTDAFLLTLGSAQRFAAATGKAGLWLSVDAQPPMLERIVETALRVGADGVKCMVYPWCADSPNSLSNFAALAADGNQWGLPVMAEVIPGGFSGGATLRTAEKVAAAARIAMEAGADVIKTFYTGDPESFHTVTQNCPVPIVVLGGERTSNDRELLESIRGALDAGAAGVAIGRNIWGHAQPVEIMRRVREAVHPEQ